MPASTRSVLACLLLAACAALHAAAQEAAPAADEEPSPVTLTALSLEPEAPTADSLCRLAVTLRNDGDRPLTSLRFVVTIGGTPVPVYEKQLFLDVVPPGEEKDIRLYNFWVTETGRPLPADGQLKVEVRLWEARWVRMDMEPAQGPKDGDAAAEAEKIETWTLLEPLYELPDPVSVSRKLGKP